MQVKSRVQSSMKAHIHERQTASSTATPVMRTTTTTNVHYPCFPRHVLQHNEQLLSSRAGAACAFMGASQHSTTTPAAAALAAQTASVKKSTFHSTATANSCTVREVVLWETRAGNPRLVDIR